MRVVHLIAAALAAILSLSFITSCYGESDQVQSIHVEGNKFVNAKGKTIVFKGLCLADPVKLHYENQWSERIFAEAEEWGSNMVRFAIHPSNLNRLGWEETFALVDEGIQWAKAHNQYVIIDWHSIGSLAEEKYQSRMYDTTMEETIKFWKTVAQRYKGEPTVALYELFNEPTYTVENAGMRYVSWTEWKGILENIIDEIRAIDPETVCIVGGFNWAYDLTPVATEPIERDNIAYVSHPYPMKRPEPWPEKWEKDWGFVADKYPVICTELGYCLSTERGAHIPVMADDNYGVEITKYMDSKGISFTIWCFDTSWAPMLISDWDYTPTTQGRFFKNYLQSQAQQ